MLTKITNKAIRRNRTLKSEAGSTLIEVVIALALLGIIGGTFLSALVTTSNTRSVSTEHAAGRIIAGSQMDYILNQPFAISYDVFEIPPEYNGYTSEAVIDNLYDGNLQKITIIVRHGDKEVTKLESYKVVR
jgi:prepilin-type N-terminal cleavage/methylation domain-containing protein